MKDIPAFPSKGGMVFYVPSDLTEQAKTEVEKLKLDTDGMALRDYFAAHAMQGMFASGNLPKSVGNDEVAQVAYQMADAMMEAREA